MTGRRHIIHKLVTKRCESREATGPRGSRCASSLTHSRRGQDLVEFALVVPVLFLFVFGILDLGRVFHVLIAISNAAREGARYGMAYGITRSVGNVYSINEPIIDAAAVQEATNLGLKLTAAQVTPTCQTDSDPTPETCGPGVRLRVQVVYNYRPIFFMVFPSTGFNMLREVEMVIP